MYKIHPTNNSFNFNVETLRHISRTVMRTKVVLTFNNYVMVSLKVKIYELASRIIEGNFQKYLSINRKRYLDDCFISWRYNLEHIFQFKNLISNIISDIQSTTQYSYKRLPFLDILITKTQLLNKIFLILFLSP